MLIDFRKLYMRLGVTGGGAFCCPELLWWVWLSAAAYSTLRWCVVSADPFDPLCRDSCVRLWFDTQTETHMRRRMPALALRVISKDLLRCSTC